MSIEPGFVLRPAEPRDADAIAEVHTRSRREAMPYLPELHTDDETRAWVAEVVLPRQEVWVAEIAGRVVGVAALNGNMLDQLYVLPGAQGRGVGSALLDTAKSLRPRGFSLYTFQRNAPARAFYERRGFVAIVFGDGSGNEEGEPDVLYRWEGDGTPSPFAWRPSHVVIALTELTRSVTLGMARALARP